MSVDIPITERARKYGYLIWPKSLDSVIQQLLNGIERITIIINGKTLGEKCVDWKRRRISLGPKQTHEIPLESTTFHLQSNGGRTLEITTK